MTKIKMKNTTDTWRIIEEYNLEGCIAWDCTTVLVPKMEYQRLMGSVPKKRYIRKLTK